jgi:hypothetical protein
MELLIVIMLLVALDVAALRWGADSRDTTIDLRYPARVGL